MRPVSSHATTPPKCLTAVGSIPSVSPTCIATIPSIWLFIAPAVPTRAGTHLHVRHNVMMVSVMDVWHNLTDLLTIRTVETGTGCQLFPVDQWQGNFCCGAAATNDSVCTNPTQKSSIPFTLDNGFPIFNRSDGSTSPNNTNAATPATTTSSSSQKDQDCSKQERTVGLGVGLPLGILLLAAIALLGWERRQRKRGSYANASWQEKVSQDIGMQVRHAEDDRKFMLPAESPGNQRAELDNN